MFCDVGPPRPQVLNLHSSRKALRRDLVGFPRSHDGEEGLRNRGRRRETSRRQRRGSKDDGPGVITVRGGCEVVGVYLAKQEDSEVGALACRGQDYMYVGGDLRRGGRGRKVAETKKVR